MEDITEDITKVEPQSAPQPAEKNRLEAPFRESGPDQAVTTGLDFLASEGGQLTPAELSLFFDARAKLHTSQIADTETRYSGDPTPANLFAAMASLAESRRLDDLAAIAERAHQGATEGDELDTLSNEFSRMCLVMSKVDQPKAAQISEGARRTIDAIRSSETES